MRRLPLTALIPVGIVAALCMSACSPSESDFKQEGEKFLEGSEVERALGFKLTGATCEQPASKSVGTIYTCTATAPDGTIWDFEIEITGDREITVQDGAPREG
jgi:hypothetical protein